MKKTTTTLIALIALTWSYANAEFRRHDLERCAQTRMVEMKIATMSEAREICENYTDENLNCAANTMRTYNTGEYYPAIQYCILEFSNKSLQRCIRGKLNDSLRAGIPGKITLARVECEDERSRPVTTRRDPVPAARDTRPVTRDPVVRDVPITRPRTESTLALPRYGFKIPVNEVKSSIAQWLGVGTRDIPEVSIERYFHVVDAAIEDTAILAGTREVRLHDVKFILTDSNSRSRRLIECTGTDFAPQDKMVNTRYFVVHECTIDEDEDAFRSIFNNINYEFLNDIPGDFQNLMNQANQNWSGKGNVSFDADSSDYLIINY